MRTSTTRLNMLVGIVVIATCVILPGCSAPRKPVDVALAQSIKSGSPLTEAEEKLGPGQNPTRKQLEALQGVLDRMPEKIRQNAEADRALSWGDDNQFLVVKVNAEGTIWVTSHRSRSDRPAR